MSLSQLIILATTPKISGGMSLIGSVTVVTDILKDSRKRQTTYHRLLLGISLSDAISSLSFIVGTWAMPKGSTWGALGTLGTCDFFGFIGQAGTLGAALYNVVLATYYLLLLKYRLNTTTLKKVEPWLHAFALVISWGVSIAGLVHHLYSSAVYVCWIGPYPSNCDSPETCERGWNYEKYRWAHYISLWVAFAYMCITMTAVYIAVRDLEFKSNLHTYVSSKGIGDHAGTSTSSHAANHATGSRTRTIKRRKDEDNTADFDHHGNDHQINNQEDIRSTAIAATAEAKPLATDPITKPTKNTNSNNNNNNNKNSNHRIQKLMIKKTEKAKHIMNQAFLFLTAYTLTWSFATMTRITLTINNKMYFPLLFLGTAFTPLQGLFNSLIYFRYKILKWYHIHFRSKKQRQLNRIKRNVDATDKENEAQFDLQEWLSIRDKTGLNGQTNIDMNMNRTITNQNDMQQDHQGSEEGKQALDNSIASSNYTGNNNSIDIEAESQRNHTSSSYINGSNDNDAPLRGGGDDDDDDRDDPEMTEWMRQILTAEEYSNDYDHGELNDDEHDYYY